LHILLALLCVVVLALAVVITVLWRRVRVNRQLADRRADVAEGHRLAGLLRFGRLEATLRPCPRIHAADLPAEMLRAPLRPLPDEDEVNPIFPAPSASAESGPGTQRSRK